MRAGVVTTLSRIGIITHVMDTMDPLPCSPRLLVVEPLHLAECAMLYAGTPTITVSLFESMVAATPATSPENLLSRARKLLDPLPSVSQLSARERQVLALVANGHSTEDVAELCFISSDAVKTHLKRIFRKLDVHNRAAAVAVANLRGLLTA